MDKQNNHQNEETILYNTEIPDIAGEFIQEIFYKYQQHEFNPDKGFLRRQEVRGEVQLTPIGKEGRDIRDAAHEMINALEKDENVRHPRFYGFIPGPAQSVSWLGDMIAMAYNSHAGGWSMAPGSSQLEKDVIDWAIEKVGLSKYPNAGGLLQSGGTMAGFTALVAARDSKVKTEEIYKATAYMTGQTHTALHKALHEIGIPRSNWRFVESSKGRMNTDDLRKKIKEDKEKGMIPFLVIGTCGTTNTGAIDPLDKIADICEDENLWFHADGAYGASVVLSDKKDLAKGIERADSIAWDGHKWLYQIYGVAFCLVKDIRTLLSSYSVGGEYLQDVDKNSKPNWWDMGPELTRPARGPRLWLTLQNLGDEKLSSMVNNSIKSAEAIEKWIRSEDRLEVVSPAQLAIITFKVKGETKEESERRNLMLSEKLRRDNIAGIFTTQLDGNNVLRICTISPEETNEDFKLLMEAMVRVMDELGF